MRSTPPRNNRSVSKVSRCYTPLFTRETARGEVVNPSVTNVMLYILSKKKIIKNVGHDIGTFGLTPSG
jgi:hypothetical protein